MASVYFSSRPAGEKRTLDVQGLFYGIGHTPNSKLVAGQVGAAALEKRGEGGRD